MKIDAWQDHIVIDPSLHHGDPCIKGTRIPVSMILGSLADGMTPTEIQEAYPQLNIDNIYATLASVYKLDLLAGAVTVVNPHSIRVRRADPGASSRRHKPH